MRIVLDTNVLVSGLINPIGLPSQLVQRWEEAEFTLVTSVEQIAELARVLQYPKLSKFIRPDQTKRLVTNLAALADVAINLPVITIADDLADNQILATALAGGASHLVTGDKRHLLDLKVSGLAILTPRQLLDLLPPH